MIRLISLFFRCLSICSKACSCSWNEVGFRRKMFWRSRSISSLVPLWTCLKRSLEKPPSVSMKIVLLPFLDIEVARIIARFDLPEPPGP